MLHLHIWQEMCWIWKYCNNRKEEKTENHGDGGPGTGFFGDQSIANMRHNWWHNFISAILAGRRGYVYRSSDQDWRNNHQTDHQFRCPVSPGVKLAFTLRYLATESCYRNLRYGFSVAYMKIGFNVMFSGSTYHILIQGLWIYRTDSIGRHQL